VHAAAAQEAQRIQFDLGPRLGFVFKHWLECRARFPRRLRACGRNVSIAEQYSRRPRKPCHTESVQWLRGEDTCVV